MTSIPRVLFHPKLVHFGFMFVVLLTTDRPLAPKKRANEGT